MDEQLREKLQKLKNLAERGVGGEKETAEKKFNQLLEKNGLKEEDLNDEVVRYYLFSFQYPYLQKLLTQVMYKVIGRENFKLYKSKNTRNKLGTYCTAAQKIEIELDFEFYRNLLNEEINVLVGAFIDKQDIYPDDAPETVTNITDLSPEEMKQYMKRMSYASQMEQRTRSLMIEDSRH